MYRHPAAGSAGVDLHLGCRFNGSSAVQAVTFARPVNVFN